MQNKIMIITILVLSTFTFGQVTNKKQPGNQSIQNASEKARLLLNQADLIQKRHKGATAFLEKAKQSMFEFAATASDKKTLRQMEKEWRKLTTDYEKDLLKVRMTQFKDVVITYAIEDEMNRVDRIEADSYEAFARLEILTTAALSLQKENVQLCSDFLKRTEILVNFSGLEKDKLRLKRLLVAEIPAILETTPLMIQDLETLLANIKVLTKNKAFIAKR